ncbi:MAG: STAS/SEC14 domain-containing protein [Gammaproteobacteria bacterium]
MANFDIDYRRLVVHVAPDAAISVDDFSALDAAIEPLIEDHGCINGLVLEIGSFPGWDSLPALRRHLRFVREHHEHVRRVAVVTDDALASLLETLARHFVAAEVRRFDGGALDAARQWAGGGAHDVVT